MTDSTTIMTSPLNSPNVTGFNEPHLRSGEPSKARFCGLLTLLWKASRTSDMQKTALGAFGQETVPCARVVSLFQTHFDAVVRV